MEPLTTHPVTPGTHAAGELLAGLIERGEADLIPNRAVLVGADRPDFGALVREATGDDRPVVAVWPNGDYLIVQGRAADTLAGELHLA